MRYKELKIEVNKEELQTVVDALANIDITSLVIDDPEDLRDIEVVVGFTEAGIAITVREWEGDSQYRNIEI
jgi:hypothetical protein